jgi:hypothetical protein
MEWQDLRKCQIPGVQRDRQGVFLAVELFDFQIQRRWRNSKSGSRSIGPATIPLLSESGVQASCDPDGSTFVLIAADSAIQVSLDVIRSIMLNQKYLA